MMARFVYLIVGILLGFNGLRLGQQYLVVQGKAGTSLMLAGIYDGEWSAQRQKNLLSIKIKTLPTRNLKFDECWIVTDKDYWKETSERCKGKTIIRLKR